MATVSRGGFALHVQAHDLAAALAGIGKTPQRPAGRPNRDIPSSVSDRAASPVGLFRRVRRGDDG